jgi:hypothetical protein
MSSSIDNHLATRLLPLWSSSSSSTNGRSYGLSSGIVNHPATGLLLLWTSSSSIDGMTTCMSSSMVKHLATGLQPLMPPPPTDWSCGRARPPPPAMHAISSLYIRFSRFSRFTIIIRIVDASAYFLSRGWLRIFSPDPLPLPGSAQCDRTHCSHFT